MHAEILMIGTELLLGQIEDTNATHMARVLAENGINLYQKTTVGDNHARIVEALERALERSDVVLCSGGLGPTEDDITRECVAEVFDRPLEYHEELFERIEEMFAQFRLQLTENNKRQAFVPRDAYIVENPHGTASGILVDDERGIVVCMPGVPHELKAMLSDKIMPFLRKKFDIEGVIHYRVLHVCGVGESRVDQAMGDIMASRENPKVGVLANPASVRIRISARAGSIEEADRLIDEVDKEIRERLPGLIMGTDDDTIEGVVDGMLAAKGWTLGLVETITGGMIGQRLTAHGASQFVGGEVLPMDGIDAENATEKAVELARDYMLRSSADCALSVLSDPQRSETAVAFVYPGGVVDWHFGRAGRNERTQLRTSVTALEHVRRHLVSLESESS